MPGPRTVALVARRGGRAEAPGLGVVALRGTRELRASSRGRPTRRAAPSRASARAARARSPCAPSSPPRPCASTRGRARASPRARRRRRGRRWPGRSGSSKQSVGVSISQLPARVEDRRALEDAHGLPVDLELDHAARRERARSRDALPEDVEPADRRLDRARRRLTEPADRGVAHALADLGDERELGLDARRAARRRRGGRAPPPGAPCPRGTGRTGRTTRRGRRRRSAGAAAAGRPCRRGRARPRSRASFPPRARPRR